MLNVFYRTLEEALDKTSLSEASSDMLRRIVWQHINEKDLSFLQRLSQDNFEFALVDLLKKIITPAPNIATVVTTNYDRLAEYAADLIGATTVMGFEGNLIREKEFSTSSIQQKRIRARERIVNIWKTHGSLDWFSKNGSDIKSFPLSTAIPPNYSPLIIAPGKGKYSLTHEEPYRSVITQADAAFSKAGSFLCIGYGFNDDHIQPYLIEKIKNGMPIVALCKVATESCKQHIISDDVKKYTVIESSPDKKTLVSGNGYREIYDGEFWQLPNFIKTIWG